MCPSRTRDAARFAIDDQLSQPLEFGYHALLDGHMVTWRLAREFPAHAADLMEIAASAYAVDRLARRPSRRVAQAGATWTRKLRIEIPVREPNLWAAHAEELASLLTWLTDDEWQIEFYQLSVGRGALDEDQGFLFDTVPAAATPILFSGGLDSGIGLARHMLDGDAIAISVFTNSWMQSTQRQVLASLANASSNFCIPLRYRVNMLTKSVESSQRSRGFLFLATGVATAWALGQQQLRVFENGIGAINLPYLRSQLGSQATRSMHPRTIRLMQSLASAISGEDFLIDAPYLIVTKAQSIRLAPTRTDNALRLTVSCDTGFSARVKDRLPCGKCTSCLLRRQSLLAANRPDLDGAHVYRTSSPEGTPALEAMLWQVDRLRSCLGQQDPWMGLVSEFPEILDAGSVERTDVINLYRSYVREWDSVLDGPWISGRPWHRGRTAAL